MTAAVVEIFMIKRIADTLGTDLRVDTTIEGTGTTAVRVMTPGVSLRRAGKGVAILALAGDALRLHDLGRLGPRSLGSLLAGTLCELKVCLTT
jgi:hypothetical protein